MPKYINLLVWLLLSTLPMSGQSLRGRAVVLEGGLSFRHRSSPLAPSLILPDVSAYRERSWGTGIYLGELGKKQREWGVFGLYSYHKDTYLQGVQGMSSSYENMEWVVTGGIYHRKYHHFTEKLFGGYQINLSMAAYSQAFKTFGGDYYKNAGPLHAQLNVHFFGGLLFTKYLGARITFGNAGIGYVHNRGNNFFGSMNESGYVQANIGWLAASSTQVSLFWVLNKTQNSKLLN